MKFPGISQLVEMTQRMLQLLEQMAADIERIRELEERKNKRADP